MTRIIVSDFDGTVTTKDTLLEFICFVKGKTAFWIGFALFLPILIAMKLKLINNGRTKEMLFSYFFKGMTETEFTDHCNLFALKHHYLIRRGAKAMMREAEQEGTEVIIVSASIDRWVQPFFPKLRVLGTQIEIKEGRLTGKFSSLNCHGKEKVARIQQILYPRNQYYITAYGDSSGDKEMLAYANEQHYKPWRD